MPTDERLRPRERLRLKRDFTRAYAGRRKAAGDALVVYVVENKLPWTRLGIVTGKRIGPAVRRNYTRRRIREAYRRNKHLFPIGWDILCVATRSVRREDRNLAEQLSTLVRKAIRRPPPPSSTSINNS